MNDITENPKITIDGVDYARDDLSDAANSQITSIQFTDGQILQLQNELAISTTARTGYLRALKAELSQVEEAGG
jgi:hypothetical protein